ncbi:MAG TPA: hypothetical protein VNO70_23875 [Blastocatellia bacterium]|nr:hypothetical protein [Blastocatellia bacterium]
MERTRTLVVSFCALLALAGSAAAQTRFTLETRVKEDYYGLNNAVFQKGLVVQSYLHAMYGNGLYMKIGGSLGNHDETIFGNEMEASVGFVGRMQKFTVDMGMSYYMLQGHDIFVPHLEVGRGFQMARRLTVKPFLRGEFPVPIKEGGPRAGTFIKGGGEASLALGERLEVNAKTTFIGDVDGAFGFEPGAHFRQYAGANWRITRKFTLILPALTFGAPISDTNDGREREVVWEGGFRYRF